MSALFNIDTSTPPRITFKYGCLRGNESAIRDKYNELLRTCSDIILRRSSDDNVLTSLSSVGEELTDVNLRDGIVEDDNDNFLFSRLAAD